MISEPSASGFGSGSFATSFWRATISLAEHRVLVAPPEHLDHLVDLFLRDDALADELARINLAHALMFADALVHQRLRVARLVGLVVAVAAEAHQVDHHVLVEFHSEIERDLQHAPGRSVSSALTWKIGS